jgi:ectoine hydroxylase-related dioxygenase (phytanoyl-CoA dioxygenase family)
MLFSIINISVSPPNPVWGPTRVQGFVNLLDCPVENGGYHAVQGFNKRFFQWAQDNIHHKPEWKGRNFVDLPQDDPVRLQTVKVPVRAGSVLIWNSQLPHGKNQRYISDFM